MMRVMAAALILLAAGCKSVQTTQPGAVGVERKQSMLVSSDTVNRSADKAYQQVLSDAQKKGQLDHDAAQLARVRGVAQRLIPRSGAFRQDAPGWNWEVHLISANDLNAWCMPGGKIAFYTGLIERLQLSDEEMAAVMGHEIAHALREHGRERVSKAYAQSIGLTVVAVALGASSAALDLSRLVLDVTFNLPNSRIDEQEADRIGVELAARGGYDPRAAISLWQKMQQAGGSKPPQFLSTHPSTETRLADLKVYAERVMPLYQQARR